MSQTVLMSCTDGAGDSVHLKRDYSNLLHKREHFRNLLISLVPLYRMDIREHYEAPFYYIPAS